MLIFKVIIWFLLLILHKMSYHIFANQFWNQLQYKSSYCSETYVNFEVNYLIFTPNLTYNVFFKLSRPSSGTSYSTSPVTVSKLMLILTVIIWFLLQILHKMSFSYFRERVVEPVLESVLEPVIVQVLLLFLNLC